MKKKILFLSALVAASTAFIGCSSDENLAEVPEVVEPVVEEPTPTASPFTFNVSVDNGTFTNTPAPSTSQKAPSLDIVTRAATVDGDVFSADGAAFTLYAFQKQTSSFANIFGGGAPYSKNDDKWTGGSWPTGTTGDCYFYALSSAGAAMPDEFEAPSGSSENAVSFTYTLPVGGDDNAYELDKQEDLLVASNTEGKTSGDVALQFSHALANLEIKYIFANQQENWDTNTQMHYDQAVGDNAVGGPAEFLYVKEISIHGLKNIGKYTYGNGWTIDDSAVDGVIKATSIGDDGFVYPTAYSKALDKEGTNTYKSKTAARAVERELYSDILLDNSLMVIPQNFTPWDPSSDINLSTDAYIAITCYVANLDTHANLSDAYVPFTADEKAAIKTWWATASDPEDLDDYDNGTVEISASADGMVTYYIPLGAAGVLEEFAANQKYVLYLDLNKMRQSNGSHYFDTGV